MFIVSITYKADISSIDALMADHLIFLDKYYATGHFLASGRKTPRTGGVIFAKAKGLTELQAILSEDPFSQHQVADFEIIEFNPGRFSDSALSLKELLSD